MEWAEVAENQDREGLEKDEGDKPTIKAEASLLTKILRTKLIPNENDVEVMQSNPLHPLYSVKSFEELRL